MVPDVAWARRPLPSQTRGQTRAQRAPPTRRQKAPPWDRQVCPRAAYNQEMVKRAVLLSVALCFRLPAEIHPMTLREAVGRAVGRNPDITMERLDQENTLARLDQENTPAGVQVARDPFTPRLTVGSGLAYSNGFPMSIEGSAPSIVQARATQFLFNRQQSFAVAQAREQVRGAAFDVAGKRDEVAYRTASFYLDAERAARVLILRSEERRVGKECRSR